MNDSYELTRRNAANYAWKSGDPDLLAAATDVFINNQESQRVNYTLEKVLNLNPYDKVVAALSSTLESSNRIEKEKEVGSMTDLIQRQEEYKQSDCKIIGSVLKSMFLFRRIHNLCKRRLNQKLSNDSVVF